MFYTAEIELQLLSFLQRGDVQLGVCNALQEAVEDETRSAFLEKQRAKKEMITSPRNSNLSLRRNKST